jgi:hypothetical protein
MARATYKDYLRSQGRLEEREGRVPEEKQPRRASHEDFAIASGRITRGELQRRKTEAYETAVTQHEGRPIEAKGWAVVFDPKVPGIPFRISTDEAQYAKDHPNEYASGRALLDLLPYGRYFSAEERDEFTKLDQQHQHRALLFNALEVAILTPGAVSGAAGKLFGLGRKLKKAPKGLVPIEDLALDTKPFFREITAKKFLRKKGFRPEEAEAVLEGTVREHYAEVLGQKSMVSKAMQDATEFVGEGGMRFPRMKASVMEELSPTKMLAEHYQTEWRRLVKKTLGKEYDSASLNRIFKGQLEGIVGAEEAAAYSLKDASPRVYANLAADMIRHPKVLEGLKKVQEYSFILPNSWAPARVVFGGWEARLGTFSNIYKPVVKEISTVRQYVASKTLSFFDVLQQRGLGRAVVAKTGKVKFKPAFSAEEYKEAWTAAKQVDGLTEILRKNPTVGGEVEQRIAKITDALSPRAGQFLRSWYAFSDSLYADYVVNKIPAIFGELGLTTKGARELAMTMESVRPTILETFATKSGLRYEAKMARMNRVLKDLREMPKDGWYDAKGTALEKLNKTLVDRLTMQGSKGGQFIGFLDNYIARLGSRASKRKEGFSRALTKDMTGFFTKQRVEEVLVDQIDDFAQMIGTRISSQASDLFLYPRISKVVDFAKTQPYYVREYTEHWLSKVMHRPSMMDEKLARFFNQRIGQIESWFGGKGVWNSRRVAQLAIGANDLAFVGGLGFKPIAALRNLFQPTVTVPTDLGGIRGFGDLIKGYLWSFNPANRAYIRSIGAIQEFLPEQLVSSKILPFQKGAKWQATKDVALWMFKGTDRINRYSSGGAAVNRWDWALSKMKGGTVEVGNPVAVARFSRKVGIHRRYPWKRKEIEDLLLRGDVQGAKDAFVSDVIADTQWLYGLQDTPIVTQKYGAVGKTGFIFQTWWTSYGTSLEKWMRVGNKGVPAKLGRMFTWMTSSAIAAFLLEQVTGRRYAMKTVGTGPFPLNFNKFMVPPSWTPFVELTSLMAEAFPVGYGFVTTGDLETKQLVKKSKAIAKSLTIFAPGGLQAQQMIKGAMEEGYPGLAKGIIRYQRAKR